MDHRFLALPLFALLLITPGLAHGGSLQRWGPGPTVPPRTAAPAAEEQETPGPPTWSAWWRTHEHLVVPARVYHSRGGFDAEGFCIGLSFGPGSSANIEEAAVRSQALPALRKLLEDSDRPELVGGALMGLARTAWVLDEEERAALLDAFTEHLAASDPGIAGSATLALGIAGGDDAARVLLGIVRDNVASRQASKRDTALHDELRTRAALALGLLGKKSSKAALRLDVGQALLELVHRPGSASVETRMAALHAASLLRLGWKPPVAAPETPSRGAMVVGSLLAGLRGGDETGPFTDARLRAQVPIAVARFLRDDDYGLTRLAEPTRGRAIRELSALALGETEEARAEVVQAAVIALGLVGNAATGDTEEARSNRLAFETLDRLSRQPALRETPALALVALARLGATSGRGDQSRGLQEAVRKTLLAALASKEANRKGWAALTLGLFGRRVNDTDGILQPEVTLTLRDAWDQAQTDTLRAPIAVALGLIEDSFSTKALLKVWPQTKTRRARAHLGVALGLMYGYGAPPVLHGAFRARHEGSADYATGLSLLADDEAAADLVRALASAKDTPARAALARAIARSRREGALAPLVELLAAAPDKELPDEVLGFAAQALGGLCCDESEAWHAPYADALHLGVDAPFLHDPVHRSGVLDLL